MGSKWFSKLGIALAGIAMAVGVGVGLGIKPSLHEAKANAQNIIIDFTSSYKGINAKANVVDGTLYTTPTTGENTFNSSYEFYYINCYSQTGYLMCYAKIGDTNPTLFSNKTAMPGAITRVTVTPKAGSSADAVYQLSIGSSVYSTSISSGDESSTGTDAFYLDVDKNDDYRYFGISVTTVGTNSGKNGQIATIRVDYDDGLETSSITVASTLETNVSVAKTVSVAYENLSNNISVSQESNNGGAVSFSSNTLTIDGSGSGSTELTITGSSAGTVIVTLSSGGTSSVITVTVRNYTLYTKLTSDAQIYNGLVVVLSKDGYVATELTSPSNNNYVLSATSGIQGTNSIAHSGAMEFTITGTVQNGWTLTNSSSNALGISSGSSGSKMALGSGTTTWSITYSEGLFVLTNSISGDYNLLQYNYNSGSPRFSNYKTTSNMQNIELYAKAATNNIYAFIGNYMRMGDNALNRETNTGACSTYYSAAKAAFNNNEVMTEEDRVAFFNESNTQYAAARARLTAWAAANHESFNGSTKVLGAATTGAVVSLNENESNNLLIAIIIAAGISTLAIGGYFFIRRKHQ